MKQNIIILVLTILSQTYSLVAVLTSPDDLILSARYAGAAGAWTAGPSSLDSVFYNPAALPDDPYLKMTLFGGTVGQTSAFTAAALSLPLEFSTLGAFYHQYSNRSEFKYTEEMLGFATALLYKENTRFGFRFSFHRMDSPAFINQAQGQTLDLGFQQKLLDVEKYRVNFGADLRGLHSSWSDDHWKDSVPIALQVGLSFTGMDWGLVSLQYGNYNYSSGSVADYSEWRFGLESQQVDGFKVRGGINSGVATTFSFGLGYSFPKLGPVIDYAIRYNESESLWNHRLQISMTFDIFSKEPMGVAPLQIIYEPGTRKVKFARLALHNESDKKVSSWKLDIRDSNGRLIRTIEGTGPIPQSVNWDGKTSDGRWMDVGENVSYQLSIRTPEGKVFVQNSFDMSPEIQAVLAKQMVSTLGTDGPSLVPVLANVGSDEISHLQIKVPPKMRKNSGRWSVKIVDEDGNNIKTLEGFGPLPDQMVWDGKDSQGLKIKDTLGLKVQFEYGDSPVNSMVVSKPIFSQESYDLSRQRALEKPVFELQTLTAAKKYYTQLQLATAGSSLAYLPILFEEPEKEEVTPEPTPASTPPVKVVESKKAVRKKIKKPVRKVPRKKTVFRRDRVLDVFEIHQNLFSRALWAKERNDLLWFKMGLAKGYSVIRVTGLATTQEKEVVSLSRLRALQFGKWLVQEQKFTGTVIIRAGENPGTQKGVRVEFIK